MIVLAVLIIDTFCALVVCLVVWFFFGASIEEWTHRRRFDGELWTRDLAADYSDWPPRLCMVDDLLARNRLNGMTSRQVVELLGPPDRNYPGFAVEYYLGPERGFLRIDSETLVIEFGSDGKVSRQKIHRD